MQYNLITSTDQNYIPYLFVLCQSILDHIDPTVGSSHDELIFHVLTDASIDFAKVTNQAQEFIENNQGIGLSTKFEWHIVDPNLFDGFNLMIKENKASYSTYYRLIMEQFIPQDVERAVYLDIDMLVLEDIRKLFQEYSLDNSVLGVVVDPSIINGKSSKELQDPYIHVAYKEHPTKTIDIPRKTYFNAGLLFINFVEWRKQDIGKKCLELAGKLNLRYHDQDLLNIVCQGKVSLLSMAWNYQYPMFYVLYNKESGKYDIADAINQHVHWQCETPSAEEFEKASASPCIVHFNGAKPWMNPPVLECGLYWSEGVPLAPRQEHYRSMWLQLSARVLGAKGSHNINADSVSRDTIKLYESNFKRKKDRKTLVALASVSLVLNFVALIHTFFF